LPFVSDELVVRRLDAEHWELVAPVAYRGNTDLWIVPEGFTTDFASVPPIAVWLIPRTGDYTLAAVLHDWLCGPGIRTGLISPVDCDGVFRRVLRELGVPVLRRWLMWAGVRWSAVTQPHRRSGWWSTAPAVLGLSVAALPILLPGLGVLLGLALYRGAERLVAVVD
jgi:hypothetical protein